MIVSRVMTKNPMFVGPGLSINETRALMDREKVGHIPVLDKSGALVGLVTKEDMLKAGPSQATSLDMYEISYLLSRLQVKDVMVRDVATVQESEVVEEAARIMADRGVGCLPVMRGRLLVGIITDTDLFRVFVKAFGARRKGVRITLSMNEQIGQLAKFAGALAGKGGNIIAFVTSEGDDMSRFRGTCKVEGLSREQVEEAARQVSGVEIEDIRE
ncbi:MAG: CBS domain-containing protein [Treponematales bacterium]